MLQQLSIRDFAIIDALDLELRPGLSVFTGETGAGKSILVGALGLILGDRADSTVIRDGAERSEITAVFDITGNEAVARLLAGQDISTDDGELYLRRVINADGRSRAYINNTPVTIQLLHETGRCLVDIHGQHAHQSLMNRDVQCGLLDHYGRLEQEAGTVRAAWQAWQDNSRQLEQLTPASSEHEATLQLLQYQVAELQDLDPGAGEYTELNEEFRRLSHVTQLQETVARAVNCLEEGEQSAGSQLQHLLTELQELEQFDTTLGGINQILQEAVIQINEAAGELRTYAGHLDPDENRLQALEKRLSDLHDMARKHRIKPADLARHLGDLQQQLHGMEQSREEVQRLQEARQQTLAEYRERAAGLHTGRKRAAQQMAADITRRMRELGMPEGRFEVSVAAVEDAAPRAAGTDKIEFLVSINPGQELRPLRKVASGGELSRISLAIQVISSRDRGIPCLVFDEVDAGIGGGVAEITGALLHRLAERRQVLCVTHLPQVASQGDHHFQVSKASSRTTTRTRVQGLDDDERIEEIARMLGGVRITARSREHAREMLAGQGR